MSFDSRLVYLHGDAEAAQRLGGEYILIAACVRGDLNEVQHCLPDRISADPAFTYSWSPLHYAAKHGQCEVVRYLLEQGANPDREEKDNFTPITVAAAERHWPVVQLLAEAGADVSHRDATGRSACDLVRTKRAPAAVRRLIESLAK